MASLSNAPHYAAFEIPANEWQDMVSVMCLKLTEITDNSKVRMNWDPIMQYDRPTGSATALRTIKKIGFDIRFDISLRGVFLTFGLGYSEEIPSMDDKFWKLLADAVKDYNLTYDLDCRPSNFANEEWEQKIHKFRKSVVYSILSDSILMRKADEDDYPIGDLSCPKSWDYNWEELVEDYCNLVKIAYRLNYMLYRSSYIKNSKK